MQPCDEHHAEQVREFCCWGDHAGVGGGDEAKAQSAYCALNAVLSAMDQRRLPLTIDRRLIPSFDIKAPSPRINLLAAGEYIMFGLLNIFTGSGVREIKSVKSLHESAIRRYKQVSTWRPEALKPLSQEIMDFGN